MDDLQGHSRDQRVGCPDQPQGEPAISDHPKSALLLQHPAMTAATQPNMCSRRQRAYKGPDG